MLLTPYHAKYLAYDLLKRRSSNDIGKLTASLQDAQVDLNPHQIDAALFAFKSPLSKGAVLADEVGLGKTIEAGIILSQQWAERKRKLLIICPSNLRKQWSQELADKFYLPSLILENKTFNDEIKQGNLNPFDTDKNIIICSFQFARNKESWVKYTVWDLVIIDEAHRLRNVYKSSNRIGNSIKNALIERKKVLLTATPLQNSILELYGLVSIIDDYIFGDLKSFKSQFSRLIDDENYEELRKRLVPICQRTLRRQVLGYIDFTERKALVEDFYPTVEEQELYNGVSEYLQRENLYALPRSQRQLMTLILRKLLASSSYAIYGTLSSLVARLEGLISDDMLEETINADLDVFDEIKEEWIDEEEFDQTSEEVNHLSEREIQEISDEIEFLKKFRDLAYAIKKNTKADKLFTALERGFQTLHDIGANEKSLIFTESRRTQEFLFNLLNADKSPYLGKVILFNGTNTDPLSNKIYKNWLIKHKGTDRISGSPTADKRASIVDYFREEATIMIATEAAAEGINLQFCSLVVNYDLPWNPQRIEQRIGRCHRYGQKHDVVVINFLNKANAADQRVYQLLSEKFKLFDGVFGASDEVLGAIGSGVDFEKRIARILLECRDVETIQLRFDELDEELQTEKFDRYQETRKKLLENVDQEVIHKLKVSFEDAKGYLNLFEQNLWKITKYFLKDYASFSSNEYSFKLKKNPFDGENIHPGPYIILKPKIGQRKSDILVPDNTNIYRVGHPLAKRILETCMLSNTPPRELIFDYSNTPGQISVLKDLVGLSGWMQASLFSISSFEDEDFILLANQTTHGQIINSQISNQFFAIDASTSDATIYIPADIQTSFEEININEQSLILNENALRNRDFFDVEMDKLDQWADDMKISLSREIEDLDAEIKLRKSEAKKMMRLEDKVVAQRHIKELEKKRSEKRMSLYEAQDLVDQRKEDLLTDIEKRLKQKTELKELFTIKWKVI